VDVSTILQALQATRNSAHSGAGSRVLADSDRIALVVLFSDTLAAVWPIYTSDEWKVVCLLMYVPFICL
jgi:hypothetical protein